MELSIYNDVCSALSDDHENVRQCALRMIWVLSHSYPERLVFFFFLVTGLQLLWDYYFILCITIQILKDLLTKMRWFYTLLY